MGAYQGLLNITVTHSFYTDAACPCLNFHPTDQTRCVFKNAGLLQKKTPDGIQIIYDESRLDALKLYASDAQEPLSFEFKVYSNDPQFKSYTEPFDGTADGILYFDNRATMPDKDKISLSLRENVSSDDLVKTDSSELDGIINHKERLLPPLMVVKIYAETEKGSHVAHWLGSELTSYSIVFNARKTVWKYYLLGDIAKPDTYISDPDNQVEFVALGETSLPGERVAFAFRSKQEIPLNQQYDFRFQLKKQRPGGGDVLINRLPVAGIGHTGRELVADQRMVVSEIYINS